jgi:hypothetical protein
MKTKGVSMVIDGVKYIKEDEIVNVKIKSNIGNITKQVLTEVVDIINAHIDNVTKYKHKVINDGYSISEIGAEGSIVALRNLSNDLLVRINSIDVDSSIVNINTTTKEDNRFDEMEEEFRQKMEEAKSKNNE